MRPLKAEEVVNCLFQMPFFVIPVFSFPSRSREEIEGFQLKRLKKIVRHAYDQVPFYKRKYDSCRIKPEDINTLKDFKNLPLVTKEEMIENFPDSNISRSIDLNKCIITFTSGSSGKIVNVVYDLPVLARNMLTGLRTYSWGMSWRPWSRQMNVNFSKHPMEGLLGTHWLHDAWTLDGVDQLVGTFKKLAPDFLSCYPSVLNEMRAYMLQRDIKPPLSLKAIFVNSEMSSAGDRKKLAEFFGAPVYDEYASEELNRIAAQCKSLNYHLLEDINYIEILDSEGNSLPDGEAGEVVGTQLLNFTMPFIRYRQNDMASIRTKDCPCGRNLKVLEKLEGRKNNHFVLKNGEILSSGFLLDLGYSILLEHPQSICDFCMVQESSDHVILELLPGKAFTAHIRDKIQDKLNKAFPANVKCELKICDRLTKTKNGAKKNPLVSRAMA